MPEFLKLLLPQEALNLWLNALVPQGISTEIIKTEESIGRICARDVIAPKPMPEFSRSTVDGYAIISSDSYGASESLPAYFNVIGEVRMGMPTPIVLKKGQAVLIHTGGMLPENADAVVMLEYTQSTQTAEIEVNRPAAPLENILRIGEDVQAGQVVIPAGSQIREAEIGGLMAFGIETIEVIRKPKITILSSGDEVVPSNVSPKPGQVRDINSHSLAAMITKWGGIPVKKGIVPDQAEKLQSALSSALTDSDGVIITAGSSASSRDLTSQCIQQAGLPGVLVHGINVRPGKPTILGVCNGKPIIGLPGNPVSALVIAWLFVPSMLTLLLTCKEKPKSYIEAKLNINMSSLAGREDWIPVKLIRDANRQYTAEPIFFKSNLIFNLVKADGLMYIPADATGFSAGEMVRIYSL